MSDDDVHCWPRYKPDGALNSTLGAAVAVAGDAVSGDVQGVLAARDLLAVVGELKAAGYTQLIDICGADYPERPQRFEVIYHFLSMSKNARLRLKLMTDAETPVPSLTGLFPVAGWFERETWDLYGVLFDGNPDLRRILTDYGFEGHPFRKDFPLTGHVELRYSEEHKRVVYEPVKLAQDFRSFDFLSPWEGTQYILPGDEKAQKQAKPDG